MITGMSHATIWVLDQDRALEFYTKKLGFVLDTDADMGGGARWLTVSHPRQPDLCLVLASPAPPMLAEEDAKTIRALVAKGAMGACVMRTDDVKATFEELSAQGVEFVQEPEERPYGVEALFRDDSGNWFSLTEAWRDKARQ
jgi:catechol 2,3-dioxygenase-like lactoylglutathione lyase family enzyme